MSDKIRVNFFVNGQGIGKPTEISTEDYIHFMIGQRDGDNYTMAAFISGKFMKNQPVSPESVSMSKAVGVPMWVFDIDRAVQNHEDTKLFEAIDGRKYGISDDDDYDENDEDDDDEDDDDEDEDEEDEDEDDDEEDEDDDDDDAVVAKCKTPKRKASTKRKKAKKGESIDPGKMVLIILGMFMIMAIILTIFDK